MGDRQYLDEGFCFSIDDREGKAAQHKFASLVFSRRPHLWRLGDEIHRPVDLRSEAQRCGFTSVDIPSDC